MVWTVAPDLHFRVGEQPAFRKLYWHFSLYLVGLGGFTFRAADYFWFSIDLLEGKAWRKKRYFIMFIWDILSSRNMLNRHQKHSSGNQWIIQQQWGFVLDNYTSQECSAHRNLSFRLDELTNSGKYYSLFKSLPWNWKLIHGWQATCWVFYAPTSSKDVSLWASKQG